MSNYLTTAQDDDEKMATQFYTYTNNVQKKPTTFPMKLSKIYLIKQKSAMRYIYFRTIMKTFITESYILLADSRLNFLFEPILKIGCPDMSKKVGLMGNTNDK